MQKIDIMRNALKNESDKIVEVQVEYKNGRKKATYCLEPDKVGNREEALARILREVDWEKVEEAEIEYSNGKTAEINLSAVHTARAAALPVVKIEDGEKETEAAAVATEPQANAAVADSKPAEDGVVVSALADSASPAAKAPAPKAASRARNRKPLSARSGRLRTGRAVRKAKAVRSRASKRSVANKFVRAGQRTIVGP
ncbi:hypothetical protein ACFPVX_09125 [Cohnella faecalis]|uniref:Uncharacterized protein n=1 Tax=Cohnella faecalis TaxID=2315694 RepID=A0A398CHB0_9BACL|nr:hypothetical protein [Cohnella faecalis]RIE01860.1 hypothetical protein D3H35_13815 [Cohnella faecalis]